MGSTCILSLTSACTYLFKIRDIGFISERDWKREFCHGSILMGVTFVPYLMYITGAKFECHYSNIFGNIFNFVFYYSHLYSL